MFKQMWTVPGALDKILRQNMFCQKYISTVFVGQIDGMDHNKIF